MEKKFKILIIDDEEKTRKLIKLCVDWEKIGCEICGEAEGGQEALDMLEELEVDLILTDIEMPYMNGLELAKNVARQYPQIKIAIVTAHENFHYAKESIQIGVCEYIVKPIKREQLMNSILQIKEQKEKEEEGYEPYQEEINNYLDNLRNSYINDAIHGGKSVQVVKKKSKLYQLDFDFESTKKRIVVITVMENQDLEEVRNLILHLELKKIIETCFMKKDNYLLYTDYFGRNSILLSENRNEVFMGLNKVAEILKMRGYHFCIGVGKVVEDWKEIKFSYLNALEAIKYKSIYGNDSVIYYEQLVLGEGNNKGDSEYIIGEICFLTKVGDLEKALLKVDNLFQQYSGIDGITNARFDTVNCVIQLMRGIAEVGFEANQFFQTNDTSFKHIVIIDNIPMLKTYLINIIGYIIDSIKNHRTSHHRSLIVGVQKYLEENYQNPEISLILVAEKFYVNQSFLSRIFKQETGVNFVMYLTKIRIEKAMKLLNVADYKIYEVAEMVGIPDANYFPKCFKKITGLTIAEYKKGESSCFY